MRKVKSWFLAFFLSSFLLPSRGFCTGGAKHPITSEDLLEIIAILGAVALGIFMMADPKTRKHRMFRVLIFGCCLSLASCATIEKSTLFGAGMGAAVGTGVGLLIEKSPGSALLGAGIFAILTGGATYLIHKGKESEEARLKLLEHKTKDENDPALTSPEVRRVWVPESIDGTTFISGHWKYLIERSSVWTR